MIKVAIIGLPFSGKTTIFNALTSLKAKGRNIGLVKVPDERLNYLHSLYPEGKKRSFEIELVDTSSLEEGSTANKSFDRQFLSFLSNIDVIIIVIRCFGEGREPIRELLTIFQELILSDLLIIEKRLTTLSQSTRGKKITTGAEKEKEIIERCKNALSNNTPIKNIGLTDCEKKMLSCYQFLTDKPLVLVSNIGEEREEQGELEEYAKINNERCVNIFGKFEMEINELEEDERPAFLKEMGIKELALPTLIKTVYDSMSLISFFTIGPDETKLWAIKKGTPAVKAAGKIHSDIEKGFIKASVVHYEDFFINNGSMTHLKEKGLIRLEGKDYIVADGDIIDFRFNI